MAKLNPELYYLLECITTASNRSQAELRKILEGEYSLGVNDIPEEVETEFKKAIDILESTGDVLSKLYGDAYEQYKNVQQSVDAGDGQPFSDLHD